VKGEPVVTVFVPEPAAIALSPVALTLVRRRRVNRAVTR
jgi:hypothetical protein